MLNDHHYQLDALELDYDLHDDIIKFVLNGSIKYSLHPECRVWLSGSDFTISSHYPGHPTGYGYKHRSEYYQYHLSNQTSEIQRQGILIGVMRYLWNLSIVFIDASRNTIRSVEYAIIDDGWYPVSELYRHRTALNQENLWILSHANAEMDHTFEVINRSIHAHERQSALTWLTRDFFHWRNGKRLESFEPIRKRLQYYRRVTKRYHEQPRGNYRTDDHKSVPIQGLEGGETNYIAYAPSSTPPYLYHQSDGDTMEHQATSIPLRIEISCSCHPAKIYDVKYLDRGTVTYTLVTKLITEAIWSLQHTTEWKRKNIFVRYPGNKTVVVLSASDLHNLPIGAEISAYVEVPAQTRSMDCVKLYHYEYDEHGNEIETYGQHIPRDYIDHDFLRQLVKANPLKSGYYVEWTVTDHLGSTRYKECVTRDLDDTIEAIGVNYAKYTLFSELRQLGLVSCTHGGSTNEI